MFGVAYTTHVEEGHVKQYIVVYYGRLFLDVNKMSGTYYNISHKLGGKVETVWRLANL